MTSFFSIIAPTATATAHSVSQSNNGLDPAIWVALIGLAGVVVGGVIAGAFAIYQFRRGSRLQHQLQEEQSRLQQQMQKEQFKHEEDIERLRHELELQSKSKEREEQKAAEQAEALRLQMLRAQNNIERARAYRQSLHTDSRISHLQILDMSRPLDVAQVYVRVRIQQEKTSYEIDPAMRAAEIARDPNAHFMAGIKHLEQRAGNAIDPEEAIRTHKRCVFVGDPGAGKTTLLKYLTLKAADNALDRLPDLPIRIELNAFASSGYNDLLDFAAADWEEHYGFPKADARIYMDEQLKSGNALLLLDALDETVIGETTETAEASYRRVAEVIASAASRFASAPIVVTARKAGYQQHAPLIGFTVLEVLDFRPEDIRQFVTNWFGCDQDPAKQANGEELNKKLELNPRLQALGANPLLLSLIVLVYEAQLDLPERRAELYKRCVDILLTEWDARRNIRRRREFKPEHKRQLLAEIAWHFHPQGRRYFPERELLEVIANFLPKVRLSPEQNGQVLAEIANEQGLLKEQAKGWQGFLHLTLQEYFVAQYVTDHQQLDELLAHRGDPWWEEVILLYAGHTPDASPLLHKLADLPEDIFCTNLILSGQCLAAKPTLQQSSLWDQVIEQLFEALLHAPYSLVRRLAAESLVAIGGEAVNRRLVHMLPDEQIDNSARQNITDALGKSSERSIAPQLLQMLPDEQIDISVRQCVAGALGEIGERSIVPQLLQMLPDEQIDTPVRWNIAVTLGKLGERSIVPQLVQMLPNEQIDGFVRGDIAYALRELGERSIVPQLVQMLPDEQIDSRVRENIADTLGKLGERSIVPQLVQMLPDEQIDSRVRMNIAVTLGELRERSIVPQLVQMLPNEQIDISVHGGIAYALGKLGEHFIVPQLVQMLPNEQIDSLLRQSIAYALGEMGERSIIPDLVQMLPDEQIDDFVRWSIAYTLGKLGERSIIPDLVQMLPDEQIDTSMRRKIAQAIQVLAQEEVDVRSLAMLLPTSDIADDIHEALWMISRRVGVRIFMKHENGEDRVEIVKWNN